MYHGIWLKALSAIEWKWPKLERHTRWFAAALGALGLQVRDLLLQAIDTVEQRLELLVVRAAAGGRLQADIVPEDNVVLSIHGHLLQCTLGVGGLVLSEEGLGAHFAVRANLINMAECDPLSSLLVLCHGEEGNRKKCSHQEEESSQMT